MKRCNKEPGKASASRTTEATVGSIGTGLSSCSAANVKNPAVISSDSCGRISVQELPLTHERVAERAKALWLESGCAPGRDEQNWREAEAQLRAESKLD
jgi:hypothetical protein